MAYISKEDQEFLQRTFSELERPVKLIYFTQQFDCEYCVTIREILSELIELSDKISLDVYDANEDSPEAERYGVDLIPGLVVTNEKDYGIRYFGAPGGYEFSSLIEIIVDVSRGTTGISEKTKSALANLKKPIHIKVFVTLSCPHCPRAVHLAHQLALESELIRADMIEAAEFPRLADLYNVGAVPKVVINDNVEFEGALPEDFFLEQILRTDAEAGVSN